MTDNVSNMSDSHNEAQQNNGYAFCECNKSLLRWTGNLDHVTACFMTNEAVLSN
jgi:hypothetical protein